MSINSQLAEPGADYPRGQRVSLMSNHICSAVMLNKKYQRLSSDRRFTSNKTHIFLGQDGEKQPAKLLKDKMGV